MVSWSTRMVTVATAAALGGCGGDPAPSERAPAKTPAPKAETKQPPEDRVSPNAELMERLKKAEAELELARQKLSLLASPFPTQGPEVAGAWETMLRKCDLAPWTIDRVECTEYPCFAGLGRAEAGPAPSGPDRLQERLKIEEKLRTCDAVVEAMGEGFDEGAVVAVWMTKTCGGKDVAFWGAGVLDPKGPAFAASTQDDETERESEQLQAWAQRRIAVLKLTYPCPP